MQEQKFDHISAVYHLLNDTLVAKSSSSSNLASELQPQTSVPTGAWPSFTDSQHLEKVGLSITI